ncbi:SgcJ/EcaC family oxidoreductase [Paraburkholderia sp.]|uniref:SgcJ/EcaC family oxidoreductase n=1 Tax=Paraburkholderia sp. TaxID=1926495 RepID=UPI002383CC0D|nr:SgcJ/EcaC family oxidoreductase [Paraburkholderia sp.]MDE1184536.1 SgcJ/EcaC family oxidoreductase [Paraburkholderia sp.]
MTDDERAIRALVDTWMSATQAGDYTAVLGLMADDVVFLVPGQAPFGKAAFAASVEMQKAYRIDAKGEIQELQILGDWAFMRNALDITITPPHGAGPSMRHTGHTLTILRKETDGRWLLARDANMVTPVA